MITIYENIFSRQPHYITVDQALERIKKGASKGKIDEIRETIDKEKANKLKMNLPSVCFSGKFGERRDESLVEHSGFIVLDFDDVSDLRNRQTEIISNDFVYACWLSPRANGLKALVRIADGRKHREHFMALHDVFPEIDRSGINVSRVCFESYDPEIYIYADAKVFTTIKKVEKIAVTESERDDYRVFKNLVTWLSNRREAFVTGERNNYIFKLASACCRFGLSEDSASNFIQNDFLAGSEFTKTESDRAIRSAYKANASRRGSCVFENERLVEKTTKKEVEIDAAVFDPDIRPRDVIYGIDVKEQALAIYHNGYEKVKGIGVADFDERFKPKRGEVSVWTGIGNYGKTTLKKWYQTFRVLLYGEKFASFSPEEMPPHEFYHDFVEIILGCDCTPSNPRRPPIDVYEHAYDFITKYVFFLYPKEVAPTPDYIFERFLEMIIKEKIDGVDIDPFNQLANDYGKSGRTDKYLETFLSDCLRFSQINGVYFWIVAHPKLMYKDATGNYPCPDVFDLADGAMWNNKSDNILVYHKPFAQTNPQDPTCEFYSKKIRRQKTVGKKGFVSFEYFFPKRRFMFNGSDPLQKILNEKGFTFLPRQSEMKFERKTWTPYADDKDEPF